MVLRPLSHRPGVIALILLLLLAASMTIFWWIARGRLLATLATEADRLRAQNWQIEYTLGGISGFPFLIEAEFETVRILRPSPNGNFTWSGGRLTLAWTPLHPNRVTVKLPLESILNVVSAETTVSGRLRLEGGEIRLAGPRAGGWLTLDLDQPTLMLEAPQPIVFRAEHMALEIRDLAAHGRDRLVATVQASLDLERFTAPQLTPLLGEPLMLSTRLTVMGEAPTAFTVPELTEWRNTGGTVELQRFLLTLGGCSLEGEATLTLDRLMRPMAAGTAKVRGFVEAIDRLIAVDLVSERDGRLARLLLSAVATADPQTGQPSLSVPVTVQDGWLLVGPSRLIPVPPLPLPATEG